MQIDETGRNSLSATPLFTVFTPTYNRAHTLHRVHDSLCAQTLRDFEWLVVDDGSTDNTEELIASWRKTTDFPIRYFKQDHSGKHIAHNFAALEASGRFFLPLDSDDACLPHALERMAYHWDMIPRPDRVFYSGVDGLCIDQQGKIIGDQFPSNPFDANMRELCYVYRVRGEKWGSTLTEIVRKFPFPEIRRTYVPEGTLWLQIARKYKKRCVNEIFRKYYVDDGLTGVTVTKRIRDFGDYAPGRLYFYTWLLNNDLEYFLHSPTPFLKAAVMLPIAARFSSQSVRGILKSLKRPSAKALVVLALPFSAVLCVTHIFARMRRVRR
jgi:glycosyltransferase involved in cell wall biosynthesis